MKCLKMVNIPPLVCGTPPPINENLHNSSVPDILGREDIGSDLDFQAFPPFASEVLEGDLRFKKPNFISNDTLNSNFPLSLIDGDTHLRTLSGKNNTLNGSKVRCLSLNHEIFSSISDNELFIKNCKEKNSSSMPEVNHLFKFSLSEELVQQRIPLSRISDEPETMLRMNCKYSSHGTPENFHIHPFVENVASNSISSRACNRQIISKKSDALENICYPNNSECNKQTTVSKVVQENINSGLKKNCNVENNELFIYYDGSVVIKPFERPTLEIINAPRAENEDEFGDFEKASFIPENSTVCNTINCWLSESSSLNIDVQKLRVCLEKVLEIMFPSFLPHADFKKKADSSKTLTEHPIIPFQEITDILLTSLEYSTPIAFNLKESSCRFGLIKSLGVDSRNVHVGKNWSNPIFAIGLNSLPMKPICNKKVENSDVGYIIETDAEIKQSYIGKSREHQINNATLKTAEALNFDASPNDSVFLTVLPANQNEWCTDKKNDLDNLHLQFWNNAHQVQYIKNGNGEPSNECLHANIFSDEYCEGVSTNLSLVQNLTSVASTYEDTIYVQSQNEMDVVVISSTFSGPLKETHIYSPNEVLVNSNNFSITSCMKPDEEANPTIFHQGKISAGIVIDETVVKKEYRDVEYHPENLIQHDHEDLQVFNNINKQIPFEMFSQSSSIPHLDLDDEFMEFQSAPAPFIDIIIDHKNQTQFDRTTPSHLINPDNETSTKEVILSPAVLIPQIKVLTNQRNTCLDTHTLNIPNTYQEIFPDKMSNYNNILNDLSITQERSLSFDCNVVNKNKNNEFETYSDFSKDDEDWSDFVSVPPKSNFNYLKKKMVEPMMNRSDKSEFSTTDHEEDWSEFMSNEPSVPYTPTNITSFISPPCNLISQTDNSITNTSSVATSNSTKTDNVSTQYNRSL